MWTCPECHEMHDDQFADCWKCAGRDHAPKIYFPLKCLRCEIPLTPLGKRFIKMEAGGLLSDFTEVHQDLDLYGCGRCGKVEFYLPDIGRDERQQPDEGI